MSFSYQVTLSDPDNVGGTGDAALVYDLQQALGGWSQYVSGAGTLVVNLVIADTTEGRESGGPTSSFSIGTASNGNSLYESSAQYELSTGQHVSGTTSDITVTVSPGYFQYLDLAANLTYDSQVPNNEYNPIVVFLHEIEHGLGMIGWYSQTGSLPGAYESNFDNLITFSGGLAYFTGANAEAAYGGPVPLTTASTAGENYYHFGNTISDSTRSPATVQDPLTLDLMNGVVFFYDYQYQISQLDLAVLKDLGYNVSASPVAPYQFYGGSIASPLTGTGSHVAVVLDANSVLTFWGSGDNYTLGTGDTLAPVGTNNNVAATTGDTIWLGAVSGDVITGGGITVHAASGASVSVGANGASGPVDLAAGTGVTWTLLSSSNVAFWGGGDTITSQGQSTYSIQGAGNTVSASTGDTIWLGAVSGDVITGAGVTVHAASGASVSVGANGASGAVDIAAGTGVTWTLLSSSNVAFWGGGDTITSQGQSTYSIHGARDTVSAGTGDSIWLGAVSGTVIRGDGYTVHATSGASASVGGNGVGGAVDVAAGTGVAWTLLSDSNASFWGGGDTITSQGQSIYSAHGANNTIGMGAGDRLWILGSANVVTPNTNDSISDYGTGAQIDIGSNIGGLWLGNFASDRTGIIDLLNGVGGYTSAAAALSAVVDDGHGNSTLSLGSAGTIHLTGETKEQLSASNFKIG